MENREKLEIPTIEFTPVTLMTTAASTCDCDYGSCTNFTIANLGDKDFNIK